MAKAVLSFLITDHPLYLGEVDENVRVGFGMDPDDKLNKANCLQPTEEKYNGIMDEWNDG